VAAWLLAGLLVVLTPLAIAGGWVRAVVLDTDQYVETVGPLVDDAAVQAALADQLTAQVMDAIDVPTLLGLNLGPLDGLVDQATDRVETLVSERVAIVVASDAFASTWDAANRNGHELVVGALTGESDVVVINDSDVSLRAEAFIEAVKVSLRDAGLGAAADLVPAVDATFVVFSSDALPMVQGGMRLLDVVGGWMWAAAFAVALGVVLVAPRRLHGLVLASGAVVLGALLLLGGVALVRAFYLTDPDAVLSLDARTAVFDQMTSLLRSVNVATIAIAVVVGLVAWLVSRLMGTPAPLGDDQSP
jgi:hypothetical protein